MTDAWENEGGNAYITPNVAVLGEKAKAPAVDDVYVVSANGEAVAAFYNVRDAKKYSDAYALIHEANTSTTKVRIK